MDERHNTVVIGDVHGLTIWQKIVELHPDDRIVFLGDYCDPYGFMDEDEVVPNFRAIIRFRKKNPDRVILLLGNHDMHYIYDENQFPRGSRFNPNLRITLRRLFGRNKGLFQYAYQDGRYLYTHAGLSAAWFRDDFGWAEPVTADSLPMIVDALNHPTGQQFKAMVQVGEMRGGWDRNGGIFWADIHELNFPVPGLRQIVGHNRVDSPLTLSPADDTSITFCDCLKYGKYNIISC